MKLKNYLYIEVDTDKESQTVSIELLRDCIIYKAHFPEQPVTPGVCIISMATELLETLSGMSLSLTEVLNAKFLAVINPDVTKSLSYSFPKTTSLPDNRIKVSVIVANKTTVFAKLSLVYELK